MRTLQSLPRGLNSHQVDQKKLLQLDMALTQYQIKTATQLAKTLRNAQFQAEQASYWLRLKAKLAFLQGKPHESLNIETALTERLNDDQKAQQAQRIWQRLQQTPQPYPPSSDNQSRQSWYQLAQLLATPAPLVEKTQESINQWQQANPGHPGNSLITASASPTIHTQKQHMCLFAPLSGDQRAYGLASQNGFMVSFYQLPEAHRPLISIRDSNEQSGQKIYQQSRALHCNTSIALLNNKQTSALKHQALDMPFILLNPNKGTKKNLFSIQPTAPHIAQAMAERAKTQGIRRSILISPDQGPGKKLAEALDQTWKTLGGTTLTHYTFTPHSEHTTSIQQTLEISHSLARKTMLEKTLWEKVTMTPRRRQDIDGFFIVADHQDARSIAPLLNYFFAADLPVYMRLTTAPPLADKSFMKDLNHTWIYDMPWISQPVKNLAEDLRQAYQTSQSQTTQAFQKNIGYYAIGYDALRLGIQLGKLQKFPKLSIQGASGAATITPENTIHQRQTWAQITEKGMLHYSEA
jgi:uncharacterized protein